MSRLRPTLALVGIAVVPALILTVVWRWAAGHADASTAAPATAATAPPSPALTTPLLSFRRSPGVLAADLGRPALAQAVAELRGTLGPTSCLVVSLDGAPVEAIGGDLPLIPASTMKLVVGAVALEVLGRDTRYTTELRAGPVAGGVISGDVFLVGGGDPLLTSGPFPVEDDRRPVTSPTSLDQLADAVVAAGVQRIDGTIVGDGSRYDDEWFAPSWDEDIRGVEAGPLDALLVNDGRITAGDAADDPAVAAAQELAALLAERGVSVGGAPRAGVAPPEAAPIAAISSAPMTDVVAELLGTSDDNTAELLVKEMGVAVGLGGSREAGLEVIRRTMEGWGVPLTGVVLADGSGLSNDNRMTCGALTAVLARERPDGALGAGLPVAGRSGTLAEVLTESPATGRMQAKTGTLGNAPHGVDPPAVKALAGYLPVDGGAAIEFALILNDQSEDVTQPGAFVPVWEALAAALATYPQGPGLAQLAPR